MYWYRGALQRSQNLNLPINHPALLYGASVFTTLRVYGTLDAPLTHWQAHCDRLRHSIDAFGWVQPDWPQVRAGATAIAQTFPVVRITLWPDGDEFITGRPLPEDLALRQQQGIQAWVAEPSINRSMSRSLPSHKTGNYLAPWLALQKARSQQAQEAILINEQGDWLETSTGNLWGWVDEHWYTPPLDAGILPGVIRQQLLTYLGDKQQNVKESRWDSTLVSHLDCLVYTNSVVEVVPITVVVMGQRKLAYEPQHPAIADLRSFFH